MTCTPCTPLTVRISWMRSMHSLRPSSAASLAPARRDRKSTRLNSSHLVISYAVFCLKKKNQQAHDSTHCHALQHVYAPQPFNPSLEAAPHTTAPPPGQFHQHHAPTHTV